MYRRIDHLVCSYLTLGPGHRHMTYRAPPSLHQGDNALIRGQPARRCLLLPGRQVLQPGKDKGNRSFNFQPADKGSAMDIAGKPDRNWQTMVSITAGGDIHPIIYFPAAGPGGRSDQAKILCLLAAQSSGFFKPGHYRRSIPEQSSGLGNIDKQGDGTCKRGSRILHADVWILITAPPGCLPPCSIICKNR